MTFVPTNKDTPNPNLIEWCGFIIPKAKRSILTKTNNTIRSKIKRERMFQSCDICFFILQIYKTYGK